MYRMDLSILRERYFRAIPDKKVYRRRRRKIQTL